VTPSHANFLLVQFPSGDAAPAVAALLAQNLMVRPLAGYGLPDAMRLTIGAAAKNSAVIDGLKHLAPAFARR
jgi:histidinol-phosphate aminotransferase